MGTRGRQAVGTKDAIMATAERLFAEHGVTAVSSRQISEAAGQGNNAAVGYHFGAKSDLIRAIVHRHDAEIEQSRHLLVEQRGTADADVRTWVECLVRPLTRHLAAAGRPSWYARFSLQMHTDPALREIVTDEILGAPSLGRIVRGLQDGMAALPEDVQRERFEMIRSLIMHTCADRERALAASEQPPDQAWNRTAALLVDAVTAVLAAPDSAGLAKN
ncbi:MAG TPA: TetR family transcriptional regulator [Actinospica sp.]|nr:TetR family transcriptional regulator [Actinospica sp.]